MNKQEMNKKALVLVSLALLIISIGLQTVHAFDNSTDYKLEYEYINIKDMAQADVAFKKNSSKFLNNLMVGMTGSITEVDFPSIVKEEQIPIATVAVQSEPKQIWHLPTEVGRVTQNPSYGHMAYDITSPRGSAETIFPIANGVISGIYTDNAGALVITVLHDINGQKYTSQYAHLSRYAQGLYVGKPVTINDSLGQMGTTGYSTGIHLHIAVLDCALFDANDPYCSGLNGFFNYGRVRINQGFIGLGSLVNVPPSWEVR